MIPTTTIIAMIASIAIVILIPLFMAIFLIRRYTMNLSAIVLGFMMYIAFDTIFLSLFDSFVLGQASIVIRDLINKTAINYTLYYAFIHALFYTAGFSVATRMVFKSDTGVGTGMALGIGCGSANVILIAAYPMVNNIIAALEINKVGSDAFLANAEAASKQTMIDAVGALTNTTAGIFLFSGFERVMLFVVFVACGIVIHVAITHRSPFAYLYVGMGVFFITYIPSALYTTGIITSVLLLEVLIIAIALGAAGLAYRQVKTYGANPLKY